MGNAKCSDYYVIHSVILCTQRPSEGNRIDGKKGENLSKFGFFREKEKERGRKESTFAEECEGESDYRQTFPEICC